MARKKSNDSTAMWVGVAIAAVALVAAFMMFKGGAGAGKAIQLPYYSECTSSAQCGPGEMCAVKIEVIQQQICGQAVDCEGLGGVCVKEVADFNVRESSGPDEGEIVIPVDPEGTRGVPPADTGVSRVGDPWIDPSIHGPVDPYMVGEQPVRDLEAEKCDCQDALEALKQELDAQRARDPPSTLFNAFARLQLIRPLAEAVDEKCAFMKGDEAMNIDLRNIEFQIDWLKQWQEYESQVAINNGKNTLQTPPSHQYANHWAERLDKTAESIEKLMDQNVCV